MSEILQNPRVYDNLNVCLRMIMKEVRTELVPELEIDGKEFGLDAVVDLSDQALDAIQCSPDYRGDYDEAIGAYLGIYVPIAYSYNSRHRYVLAEKLIYVPAHQATYGCGFGPYHTVAIEAAYRDASEFSDAFTKKLVDTNRTMAFIPLTTP